MGLITAAGLGKLAIQAAPQLINTISTAITNRQQKKFAEKQYQTQRSDNLADWNRQNEYNSPISQMTRLNEAGLNPNLIYKGGATNQSGEISRAQFGSYNPQAPKFEMDIADSLSKYQNYQNQQLQADNLKQNLQVAKAQEEYIKANTLNRLKDTDFKAFNIYKGNTLLDYQSDAAREKLYLMRAQTAYTYGQNERAWILSAPKVEETLARAAQIKAQTTKVDWEKQLLQQNVQKLRTGNYWLGQEKGLNQETNKILQESALMKNLLMGKQGELIDVERQTKQLEQSFKQYGVKPSVAQDIIQSVLSILGRK
jgi:hypothetical protein